VPRKVTLVLSYYQRTRTNKRIISAEIGLDDYEVAENVTAKGMSSQQACVKNVAVTSQGPKVFVCRSVGLLVGDLVQGTQLVQFAQ